MRISLDAGALCVEGNLRFGNYTFTKNLIETMVQYDGENEYFIYSFCQKHITRVQQSIATLVLKYKCHE